MWFCTFPQSLYSKKHKKAVEEKNFNRSKWQEWQGLDVNVPGGN